MKSVAIIGQGFVGGSLTTVLAERGVTVYVCDKSKKVAPGGLTPIRSGLPSEFFIHQVVDSATELAERVDALSGFSGIYFVCVPTPMLPHGEADLSIVDGVLLELRNTVTRPSIAVVRSTVPPGSTEMWNKTLGNDNFHVVFNPEFLTEANALEDLRNQSRIVLGGPRPWINTVRLLYRQAFPGVPIVKTSSTMAEMVKYFTNVQLAARVVLSCELWQVCEALEQKGLNVDYDKVVEYAKLDARLGGSHMDVPGNDGIAGARGHCFPKDLRALTWVARAMGVEPTVMEALWRKNLEVVPEDGRDWEKMPGRAVSG